MRSRRLREGQVKEDEGDEETLEICEGGEGEEDRITREGWGRRDKAVGRRKGVRKKGLRGKTYLGEED